MLYLDVDGVVFPLAEKPGGEIVVPAGYHQTTCAGFAVCFNPQVIDWITGYAERGALTWVSSWEQSTNHISEEFGFPQCPWLPTYGDKSEAVLNDVSRFRRRPFAWVEDNQQTTSVKEEVLQRRGLLICPKRHIGLTFRHMSSIDRHLLAA